MVFVTPMLLPMVFLCEKAKAFVIPRVVNKFGSYVQFYNLYQLLMIIVSLSVFKVSNKILKL